jgi:hypothetical protein
MDTEQTIAEIEWLEHVFAVRDTRPLSPSDLSAANRADAPGDKIPKSCRVQIMFGREKKMCPPVQIP